MGVHVNIDFDRFPEQGSYLNKRVRVCFDYDTSRYLLGVIVRDDRGEPGVEIIKLDDGRFVLTTECQYSILPDTKASSEEWPETIGVD